MQTIMTCSLGQLGVESRSAAIHQMKAEFSSRHENIKFKASAASKTVFEAIQVLERDQDA